MYESVLYMYVYVANEGRKGKIYNLIIVCLLGADKKLRERSTLKIMFVLKVWPLQHTLPRITLHYHTNKCF